VATESGSNSEIRQPPFLIIFSARFKLFFGYKTFLLSPEPGKAIVVSPASKADW